MNLFHLLEGRLMRNQKGGYDDEDQFCLDKHGNQIKRSQVEMIASKKFKKKCKYHVLKSFFHVFFFQTLKSFMHCWMI